MAQNARSSKMSEISKSKLVFHSALPYLQLIRADSPIGYWLLLWPCWLAIALTSPTIKETVTLLLLFLLGAIFMRGAGCIFNDIVDRKFDVLVTRTRMRPIACGKISVIRGVLFMSVLSLFGLLILLQLNETAMLVGLGSIPLIIWSLDFSIKQKWFGSSSENLTFQQSFFSKSKI